MKKTFYFMLFFYNSIYLLGSNPTSQLTPGRNPTEIDQSAITESLATNIAALKAEIHSLTLDQKKTNATLALLQAEQAQHGKKSTTFEQHLSALQQEQNRTAEVVTDLQNQQICQNEHIIHLLEEQKKQTEKHSNINDTLTETNAALRRIATLFELSQNLSNRSGIALSVSPAQKIDRPCRRHNGTNQKPPWHY